MQHPIPVLTLAGALAAGAAGLSARAEEPAKPRPRIEVVFVLDTTGSMSGLLEGAKKKIWSITNQIVSGKPSPEVKIGLVAYRDRNDAYVTKMTPLTADVDGIYSALTELKAQGGGDTPESVNQALHEAVTKLAWSKDSDTLKIVYLVGDAPPHMDYTDDVKHPETCNQAVREGILINTVQCGGMSETRDVWQAIARSAEGQYAAIPQDGGVVAVTTPFDRPLAEVSARLGERTYLFGSAPKREADAVKLGRNLAQAPEGGAARAAVQAKRGRVAEYDLLDALKEGRADLAALKDEELPEMLRGLSSAQRSAKVAELRVERERLLMEIRTLTEKRDAFLAEEQKKAPAAKDGFDEQVLSQLRSQAKRFGIRY